MNAEVKIFLERSWIGAKYFVMTIMLAFMFFLFRLTTIPSNLVGERLFQMLSYTLIIGLSVLAVFAIYYLIIACRLIKSDRRHRIKIVESFVMGLVGIIAGYLIANNINSEAFHFNDFGMTCAISSFILLIFIFISADKQKKAELKDLNEQTFLARYEVLKNQMQPHFLFNSLNCLSELVMIDQLRAREMTQKLSDLYREILENSKSLTTTLESEIVIATKYLELEQMRFGEKLKITISYPEIAKNLLIPSLILQTLVENAIKHGISKNVNGGEVCIVVSPVDSSFKISITNTTENVLKNFREGTGLTNAKARLAMIYGTSSNFSFKSADDLTVVSFCVAGDR